MRSRPAPASRANKARSAAKNGLDTPFDTDQKVSPEVGLDEGGDVQPLVTVVAEGDGPLPLGGPHASDDRLQADAVLVGRPDLDRLVRVLGPLLGNNPG